jgi:hypothetical protein
MARFEEEAKKAKRSKKGKKFSIFGGKGIRKKRK